MKKRSKTPQDDLAGIQPGATPTRRNSSQRQRSAGASSAPAGPAIQGAAPTDAGPNLARILNREVATRWMGTRARDFTPDRIEQTLTDAMAGSLGSQWELFALMEDTWPRLAKALLEIKRAVVAMDWHVEPWAEDGQAATDDAQRKARLISGAIWKMRPPIGDGANGFEGTVFDLLDAWGKGVSVLEVTWEARQTLTDGLLMAPQATYWVDPANYGWHGSSLRLRMPGDGGGALVEFPPDRFLVGICKARSGPLSAAALLRPLAWWWCAANFSAGWLLNLSQIFGLPIRWATYAAGSQPNTINAICSMLENMGSSAWGAFPAGTSIELKESQKSAGQSPQDSLLDRADKQVDLLILGQTLTTDVGSSGSRALGGVHMSVLDEIKCAAAGWAAMVLNQQLVSAICRANWGTDMDAPELCPKPSEQRDLAADAARLKTLREAGLRIPTKWAHESQGIPIPEEGEETLGDAEPSVPDNVPPQHPNGDQPLDPQDEGESESDPATDAAVQAKGRQGADNVDAVAAQRSAALASAYRGSLAPLRKIVEASSSVDDLKNRIREFYADWSPGRAAVVAAEAFELMAAAGAAAHGSVFIAAGSADQPRDDNGQWAETGGAGGGSGGGGGGSPKPKKSKMTIQQAATGLQQRGYELGSALPYEPGQPTRYKIKHKATGREATKSAHEIMSFVNG